MSECKLCGQEKELKRSHIIPSFVYKMVRSDEIHHRFFELSTDPYKKKEFIQQSEIRERLLCGCCEQKIGVWEKYAKETLFVDNEESFVKHENVEILQSFDYIKLKLFFLSILWRMSIAKDAMFSEVSLGPHENRIKQMLLQETIISTWDYPIFATYPLFDGSKHEDIILAPSYVKINAHRIYRFIIGGICVFIATNPNYEANCKTKPIHMTTEQFPIPKIRAEKIAFINNWIAEWVTLK